MTGRREPRHASGTTRPAWPRWSPSRPSTCWRTTSRCLPTTDRRSRSCPRTRWATGWDLFGTAGGTIDYGIVNATVIWYLQVGALVAGHACGLVLSHDRALALYGKAQSATASQYWMLAVMVAFTTSGLFLLSQANQ